MVHEQVAGGVVFKCIITCLGVDELVIVGTFLVITTNTVYVRGDVPPSLATSRPCIHQHQCEYVPDSWNVLADQPSSLPRAGDKAMTKFGSGMRGG
jgi:hypothetical protein